MLHFFPKSISFVKKNYKPRFILRIQKLFEQYDIICSQLEFYNKFKYKFVKNPAIRVLKTRLESQKESIFSQVITDTREFIIYKRNSRIPEFLMNKTIFVHQGKAKTSFIFDKYGAINKRFGQYTRTKPLGAAIHKNNKIVQKKKKKAKMLMIKSLWKRSITRKRAPTKSVKRRMKKK